MPMCEASTRWQTQSGIRRALAGRRKQACTMRAQRRASATPMAARALVSRGSWSASPWRLAARRAKEVKAAVVSACSRPKHDQIIGL